MYDTFEKNYQVNKESMLDGMVEPLADISSHIHTHTGNNRHRFLVQDHVFRRSHGAAAVVGHGRTRVSGNVYLVGRETVGRLSLAMTTHKVALSFSYTPLHLFISFAMAGASGV